ncbi:CatB-related O-acetyltransferase [uncultured Ilyobacter sp.]|uniref:CatB-related O-acetyltransferase n=1 Tax=uncultured Ilyobacter sp. TaxID=544433 RepID=UPI0029F58B33|nr:CatB-related O-acetyltransferase [uncultured Ilyobacter sp.]
MIKYLKYIIPHEIFQRLTIIYYKKKKIYIGKNIDLVSSKLEKNCRLAANSSIRYSALGKYSSIGRNSKVNSAKIGKFCSISWDCTIGAVPHNMNNMSINSFPYKKRLGFIEKDIEFPIQEVELGNDVWVGANSVIINGVKIGHGAVVGAGAVVTKNIPPYAIVAGVPAKIIKYRFSEEIINELLEIEWWNCNDVFLKKNLELFQKKLTKEALIEFKENLKEVNNGIQD